MAKELASALQMNYAYGVEFVYSVPIGVGEEPFDKELAIARSDSSTPMVFDPARYKGLHGNAILSRYPLENVRLIPLPPAGTNQAANKKNSKTEQMATGEQNEPGLLTITLNRVGWRMGLLAEISDPEFPMGRLTIISTHLEALAKPSVRRKQLTTLLAQINDTPYPVILAGDLNTIAIDTTPVSVWRVIKGRARSKNFWLTRGLAYLTGVGLLLDAVQVVIRFGRTQSDPTVAYLPVIAPNPEAGFFKLLKEFRFKDGGAFDFRGDRHRSTGSHTKTLANSNERGGKGFRTTFELTTTFWAVGKFKLDWILVKPPLLSEPTDRSQPYRFAPHFGRTLKKLNYGVPKRISDHDPLVVDLPFGEPPIN